MLMVLLQVGNSLQDLKAQHVVDELEPLALRQQLVRIPEDVHRVEVDDSIDHPADALHSTVRIAHFLADDVDGKHNDVENQCLHDAAEKLLEVEPLSFNSHAGQQPEDAVQQEDEENNEYYVFQRGEVAQQYASDGGQ